MASVKAVCGIAGVLNLAIFTKDIHYVDSKTVI